MVRLGKLLRNHLFYFCCRSQADAFCAPGFSRSQCCSCIQSFQQIVKIAGLQVQWSSPKLTAALPSQCMLFVHGSAAAALL